MKSSQYLKIFTFYSYFKLILGEANKIENEAIDEVKSILKNAADGQNYIDDVVNGKEIKKRPEILMFTAPYRLCEGGCKGRDGGNIQLQFPVFVGSRGRKAYQRLFNRDFNVLHAKRDPAPFKKRTTKANTTTTPCVILKVEDTTTPTTTTTSTTTTTTTTIAPTTVPAITCPTYPSDVCLKKRNKIRKKKRRTVPPQIPDSSLNENKTKNTLDRFVENATKIVRVGDYDDMSSITIEPIIIVESDVESLEDTKSDYNFYDHVFKRIYNNMMSF